MGHGVVCKTAAEFRGCLNDKTPEPCSAGVLFGAGLMLLTPSQTAARAANNNHHVNEDDNNAADGG